MQCLQSIKEQNLEGIEIVVLSDASPGKDDKGYSAKKIVRQFSKEIRKSSISIQYLENSINRSLIETRRILVEHAQGDYIFMLDSDDFLAPDSLSVLYDIAVKNNADIVQGDCVTLDPEGKNHIESKNEFHPYIGILEGRQVFDECFCSGKYRPVINSKLIKRELYLRAYNEVPVIYTHMAEAICLYFFIALFAEKYIGLNIPVYMYRIGVGITTKIIDDLKDWKTVCSAASVFTAIYFWIETKTKEDGRNPLTEEEMKGLQICAKASCINSVELINWSVVENLRPAAREMLCEYWGEEAVKNTEEFLKRK